jgi:hypothetical protein
LISCPMLYHRSNLVPPRHTPSRHRADHRRLPTFLPSKKAVCPSSMARSGTVSGLQKVLRPA